MVALHPEWKTQGDAENYWVSEAPSRNKAYVQPGVGYWLGQCSTPRQWTVLEDNADGGLD
jgi:hypothetical protein